MLTTIYYYISPDGRDPVNEFLNSLNPKQQSKLLRIFKTIKEYGLQMALPHIKKLFGTPLWEIRVLGKDNIRIFYVVPTPDAVLVLHGFIKKTQKTDQKEINLALKRLESWSKDGR